LVAGGESGVDDSEVDESGVGESEGNEAEPEVGESVAGAGESEVDGVTESSEADVDDFDEIGVGLDGGDGDVEYGVRLTMAA
jgi:hypothetical protein